jgi:hypothetical protein
MKASFVVDFFYKRWAFTERELKLLRLMFNESEVTRDDISDLLQHYDIEAESLDFLLPLAQLMRKIGSDKFPKKDIPRLEGIVRFFRYKSTTLFSNFKRIGGMLAEQKIDIMPLKGLMMRHVRKDFLRHMWDIDFAVRLYDFERAMIKLREVGYKPHSVYPHSADLVNDNNKKDQLDLHRFLSHYTGKPYAVLDQVIWSRAEDAELFGVPIKMPTLPDMIYLTMINAYFNVMSGAGYFAKLNFCIDCTHLILKDENLDWDMLVESCTTSGAIVRIKIVATILKRVLPWLPISPKLIYTDKDEIPDANLIFMEILAQEMYLQEAKIHESKGFEKIRAKYKVKLYIMLIKNNCLRKMFGADVVKGIMQNAG